MWVRLFSSTSRNWRENVLVQDVVLDWDSMHTVYVKRRVYLRRRRRNGSGDMIGRKYLTDMKCAPPNRPGAKENAQHLGHLTALYTSYSMPSLRCHTPVGVRDTSIFTPNNGLHSHICAPHIASAPLLMPCPNLHLHCNII